VQDTRRAGPRKRHRWDPQAPFAPRRLTIARNRLIGALRRRGRRGLGGIGGCTDVPPGAATPAAAAGVDGAAHLRLLPPRRRRGRRVCVDIDDFTDVLPGEETPEPANGVDVAAHLQLLPPRQRDVLQAIAVDGLSISETGEKFTMKEGAVRVALHRGLTSL